MSIRVSPPVNGTSVATSSSPVVDNSVPRFNGTSGGLIQDSLMAITDLGSLEPASGTTLTIGGETATTINIGRSGATVNIIGTTNYEQTTNTQVADKLVTYNKGGAASTATGSGFELEEDSLITGYFKTSADRNSFVLLAPNTTGIITLTPGSSGFTLDDTIVKSISSSITDNSLVRMNGTTGKSIQASSIIIDDSDNISGIVNLTVTGTTTLAVALSGFLKATAGVVSSSSAISLTADVSGTLPVANGGTGVTSSTGSVAVVLSNSPTLVTPILGVASATSINKVAITAPATSATLTIADGKTLTVSNTLTFTGTDASSVAFGAGGTVAYTANKLSVFAATTSAELAGVISDETGSGALVFGTNPQFTTSLQLNAQAEVRFADSDSSNYVALKAPATVGTNYSLTLPDVAAPITTEGMIPINLNGVLSWTYPDVMQNYIYNGDMQIWNEGTALVAPSSNVWGAEGFRLIPGATDAVLNINRSTSIPTVSSSVKAFNYSYEIDVTTADASIGSTQRADIQHYIEGSVFKNIHQKQVTLSFWVYATKTGTSCVFFQNSANNRSYIAEFTILVSNTWEYKTITLTLDTSGTWLLTDGTRGLYMGWALAAGTTFQTTANSWQAGSFYATSSQINHLDSTSNFFRITGVKLNLGPVATPFTLMGGSSQGELAICQRYWEQSYAENVAAGTSTEAGSHVLIARGIDEFATIYFKVEKCKNPTMTTYSTTGVSGNWRDTSAGVNRASITLESNKKSWVAGDNAALTSGNVHKFQWTANARL